MSNKIVAQSCAICDREKQQNTNGMTTRRISNTENSPSTSPSEKDVSSYRHKYGNLPAKKHDDFFTQVTEPQWLRRGNLKETDYVCKRHLAILMRGVDRGCEGGCCSPLHRGARICRPSTLKSIPPAWRIRFVNHPKIKEEDKTLMLLCWACYKKHMDRMSKYGDPMGRTFSGRQGIQRSNSLIDTDTGPSILQAMKRYKSMDKLDSGNFSPVSMSPVESNSPSPRRVSASSMKQTGQESTGASPELPADPETRSSPSRRTVRGRKINKGRRSPSPPNNISPVRTSVVHSRRKHSPHKGSKSPSARSIDASSKLSLMTQSSPDLVLSTRNLRTSPQTTRKDIDEGNLAGTDSPRPAPVPPAGLFSARSDRSDDVIDVFGTRKSKSPRPQADKQPTQPTTTGPPKPPHVKFELTRRSPSLPTPRQANVLTCADVKTLDDQVVQGTKSGQEDEGHEPEKEATDPSADGSITVGDIQMIEQDIETPQVDESVTSADEMADIFPDDNQPNFETDPAMRLSPILSNGITSAPEGNTQHDLEDVTSESFEVIHNHESSGSSSDKTGETQIAAESYAQTHLLVNGDHKERDLSDESNDEDGSCKERETESSRKIEDGFAADIVSTMESAVQTPDTSFTVADMKDAVFVSPQRRPDPEGLSPNMTSPVLNYSLSPQSLRRLDSIKLSFAEVANETDESQTSSVRGHFDDDVRDYSHPMRNHVLMKVPKGSNLVKSSFVRIEAEDVEIFPDNMSFLEGVTQLVGEDMNIYSKGDVQLVNVNLQKENNRKTHRTSQFACEELVVRRGQAFEIELQLNETYEEHKHNILLELMTGEHPRASNGTHIFLPLQLTEVVPTNHAFHQVTTWSVRFVKTDDKLVTLSITPPSSCLVGSYKMFFQVKKDGRRSRWTCGSDDDQNFIVLFNPWCIDDAVFMSSESDRQEYVISDTGRIYTGNKSNLLALPWIFGQYEDDVLPACIRLVQSCNLTNSKRGDPVSVAQAISRFVALSVTDECTKARMQEDYISASSAEALFQYYNTGVLRVPNDNIVISALLVTVFRCLGYPARPVSCLDCAVETDLPLTVNLHYSEDGQELDYLNSDTMWPSYCWAAVWMSRVDLPPGFGGWQAIQTSVQNATGPTPVYAIKKGQTSCCAGTQMYFMALNADKKHWIVHQDGTMELMKTDRNATGSMVVTKSVGNPQPQDITKLYKFHGGCEENKLALHTAHMHCGTQDTYDENQRKDGDLTMSLMTHPNVTSFGSDVEVITRIKNSGQSVSHLTININGAVLSPNGTPVLKLSRETILAEVLKGESVEIPVKVNLSPCLHKLAHDRHLVFMAFATVRDKMECRLLCSHLMGIKFPDVEIQLHGEFKVGGEVTVSARIRNPLSYVLHNARMRFSTSGLTPLNISTKSGKSVGPWNIFKCERVFRCQRSGKHTVVARFASDQMTGPVGIQEIEIT